jgi:hypothetical protein
MGQQGLEAGLFSKQGAPIPLRGVEVRAEVLGGYAQALVRQRYKNEKKKPWLIASGPRTRGTIEAMAMKNVSFGELSRLLTAKRERELRERVEQLST